MGPVQGARVGVVVGLSPNVARDGSEATHMAVIHGLLLLGCAVVIYLSCEWFVNAVEWLGIRMRMGTLAIGTILAAAGTALPESVVTLVAVTMRHSSAAKQIGVGAAMGGPLALATIAYGVTGFMLLRRKRILQGLRRESLMEPGAQGSRQAPDPMAGTDLSRLPHDQQWFLAIFAVKVALGLVAFSFKPVLGLLFFAAYAAYFVREMRHDAEVHSDKDLEPLKLQPHSASPAGWAIAVQTLATLALIFAASQLFVSQLEWAGPALGLAPAVTALLLSPIATELPEVMNAVIWVRQGKTSLALANISGAMMIQATIPSGLGILFTPWKFDHVLMLSGAITMLAIAYLLWLLAKQRFTASRLAWAFAFYPLFAVGLLILR